MASEWTIRENEQNVVHRELLGMGGYGEVHKMVNTVAGKYFARKVMRLFGAVTKADIENEVRAVNKLCKSLHRNIVQVFDLGQMRSNSTFYYIDMELCDISLGNYMQGKRSLGLPLKWEDFSRSLENTRRIKDDILDGLIFIHSNNEVHRDLSPQNILSSSMSYNWKIADFGLTSPGISNRFITTHYSRGRACYRAPELLREDQGMYSNKADILSLDCVLFEMTSGKRAFSSDFAVFQYALSPAPLDGDGRETVDPKQRPSAKQLRISSQIFRYIRRHNRDYPDSPINSTDGSALRLAALSGNLGFLDCIVQDAELMDPSWWREVAFESMTAAVRFGNKEVVHLLLEAGVDGSVALFSAARSGDHSEMRYLAESNIRGPSEMHNRLRKALVYAIECREEEAVEALIRDLDYLRSFDFNSLYNAIRGPSDRTCAGAIAELFCRLTMVRVQTGENLLNWRIRVVDNISRPISASNVDGDVWFTVSSNSQLDDLELDLHFSAKPIDPMLCIAISPDGMYLGTRSWSSVRIFEIALSGALEMRSTTSLDWEHSHRLHIPSLCFLADSRNYFTSGPNAEIRRCNFISILREKHNYFGSHKNGVVTSLAVSQTGHILISASSDHTVRIWDVLLEVHLHEFSSLPDANISLSPDGHWMAIGSSDRDYVSIWDIQGSRVQEKHDKFRRAAFSPSALLVLSDRVLSDQEGRVCTCSQSQDGFFDVSKWGEVITGASLHLSFTSDGLWLVCGRMGRIEFRNSRTGALRFAVYGPNDRSLDEICNPMAESNLRSDEVIVASNSQTFAIVRGEGAIAICRTSFTWFD